MAQHEHKHQHEEGLQPAHSALSSGVAVFFWLFHAPTLIGCLQLQLQLRTPAARLGLLQGQCTCGVPGSKLLRITNQAQNLPCLTLHTTHGELRQGVGWVVPYACARSQLLASLLRREARHSAQLAALPTLSSTPAAYNGVSGTSLLLEAYKSTRAGERERARRSQQLLCCIPHTASYCKDKNAP